VVTMKNVVFWDIKTPVRTSQETHYFSAAVTTKKPFSGMCRIVGLDKTQGPDGRVTSIYSLLVTAKVPS
jgi:hypothetical protein